MLYEDRIEKTSEAVTIEFRAGYIESGRFKLTVFSGESELMQLSADFETK